MSSPDTPAIPDKKPLAIDPALALLEFSSIAAGIQSADAMVKRAALDVIRAGTVQPGRFLVLVGGTVAEVEEALKAGRSIAPEALNDHIFLPGVHPDVVRALAGERNVQNLSQALGIIETRTVPAAIHAADQGVKGADVALMEMRLADGLGGKGVVLFTGEVSAVEAALEIVDRTLQNDQKIRQVVIPQLHSDLAAIIHDTTRFGAQVGWLF